MINKNELLKNWQILKISDLCEVVRGGSPRPMGNPKYFVGNIPFLKIADITKVKGKFVFDSQTKVNELGAEKSRLLKRGSLVLTNSATVCVPKFLGVDACIHDGFVSFQNFKQSVSLDFLYYYFDFVRPFVIQEHKQGVTQVNLNIEIVNGFEVFLPPLAEQERIVAKIEELFTELDAGIESLKTAAQQLKTYRQAVLKWAFEGKLTNENINEGKLPDGWKWEKSGNLFSFVTSGSRGWAKYYADNGAIFVRITNLNFDTLELDLRENKIQYVKPPENSEGLRTKIQEGDFLFSITGYLGMFAIAPKLENAFVNQHIALCRPKNNFKKKYIGYWIISKSGGIHHLNLLRKGAVKAGLGLDDIKNFPVPICSLEEQQRIVEEIESRLSVCDKLEETINQSLAQAESLRQSILKQAFEGKLVKIKEIEKPKKTDFQKMQDLGFIINRSRQRKVRYGEMVLAKYAFLADRIYDVKIYDKYERWHLGPYPTEIKKHINNRTYFRFENGGIRVLNEEKLFKYSNPDKERIEKAVDELSDIFGKINNPETRANKTELLATVCKVIEDIQTTDLDSIRQSMKDWKIDLKNRTYKNKAEKFNEDETAKCIEFIKQKGWDKKLIK